MKRTSTVMFRSPGANILYRPVQLFLSFPKERGHRHHHKKIRSLPGGGGFNLGENIEEQKKGTWRKKKEK
jgi:hypothetical protein